MRKIIGKILCFIGLHNQIEKDGKGGWWTRPHCLRCEKPLPMPNL